MSIYNSGEKVQGQSRKEPENQQFKFEDANRISELITSKITTYSDAITFDFNTTSVTTQTGNITKTINDPSEDGEHTHLDIVIGSEGSTYTYTPPTGITPTSGTFDPEKVNYILYWTHKITGLSGTIAERTQLFITTKDLPSGVPLPLITGETLQTDNTFTDVTFNTGVSVSGGGAVTASNFQITNFASNGDDVTAMGVTTVTNNTGGALTGGESIIRVFHSRTGSPSTGLATFQIEAVNVFNSDDQETTSTSTSTITLNNQAGDVTPPTWVTGGFEVGTVADNIVVLPVSEALDTGSVPDTTDFDVQVDASGNAVTTVDLSTLNEVRLTLTTSVTAGQTVTVAYTKGTNPIQDVAGNDIADLVATAVTNNVADNFTNITFASTSATATATDNNLTSNASVGTWNALGLVDGSFKVGQLSAIKGTISRDLQGVFSYTTNSLPSNILNATLGVFVNGVTGNYDYRVNSTGNINSMMLHSAGDEMGIEQNGTLLTYFYIRGGIRTDIATITVTDVERYAVFAINAPSETISDCQGFNF